MAGTTIKNLQLKNTLNNIRSNDWIKLAEDAGLLVLEGSGGVTLCQYS